MFFDAHADILTDVTEQKKFNIDIWEDYHKPKYFNSNVKGGIFVNFSDPKSTKQNKDFQNITDVSIDYFKNKDDIKIVLNKNDFIDSKFNLILGIEGLNCLTTVAKIDELFNLGYRHFSMTWNEKNTFATGAFETGGITQKGVELIKRAEQLGMILDLSHLNEQSFFEAAKITTKPLLISHANVKKLCNHPRNLSDQQLFLIKETNGIIGLSAINSFLNENKVEASINDLIKHIVYIKNLIGVEHIGFGFDFCYYLNSHDSHNKVQGLNFINDIVKIPSLLLEEGFTQDEIKKICFQNMLRVIKEHLK